MSLAARLLPALDNTFVRDLQGLYEPWRAAVAPDPRLLLLNDALAGELGLDVEALRSPEGVDVLVGNTVPEGSSPVAQAYAGHQFGGFTPRLGDGRALLVGELVDRQGRRRDLHLKGSGRTPFARGGDGKAAVGPMLREYVIGEAMHALGIPTTRALAVTATGADISRDTIVPGAVLARVAASHLRVGTFHFAALEGGPQLLRRLADHAIARHHPGASETDDPYLTLLEEVVEAQASLVARWMLVGFVHGVMNTDNTTISGETIDYGPCAFLDAYDPRTVFSSIDSGGRYSFGNQPHMAQWNLARLGEALLPILDDDEDVAVTAATAVLATFGPRFEGHWSRGMRAKLGLTEGGPDIGPLVEALLALLTVQRVDFTSFFRSLASLLRGDDHRARALFAEPSAFDGWAAQWLGRLPPDEVGRRAAAAQMDRVNPIYIPRNHMVEDALEAATAGEMALVRRLLSVVSAPFEERPGLGGFAVGAPPGSAPYRTFCGT